VLGDDTIGGFDLALFSAGGGTSREWAPRFVAEGAVVVDNSSAWRMNDDVPLVVAEVNADALADHRGIVANPNCTTMVAMLPLKALHDQFGLRAMVATSFQAAGGAGQKGIDELAAQVGPLSEDVDQLVNDGDAARRKVEHSVHADTLAFNVVPMLGKLSEGYTDEEMKLQNESRKILSIPDLAVSPTCVRVPVYVGHSIAVRATFEEPVDAAGVGRPRRGRRRPRAPRSRRSAHAEPLRGGRQPAQGRRPEHGPDRRGAARTRPRAADRRSDVLGHSARRTASFGRGLRWEPTCLQRS
jgi:aspartate-semialdehyde dehydrogenase